MATETTINISNLPASNSFSSDDILAVEENGVTYKISCATLIAALKSVGGMLTTSEVANNTTTTSAGMVLDARQGKALSDAITAKITNANAGTYNVVADAALGVWDTMQNYTVKIGWFTRSTAWAYFAYKNSANYSTMIAFTYGQPLVKIDKVNGVLSTYTYTATSP